MGILPLNHGGPGAGLGCGAGDAHTGRGRVSAVGTDVVLTWGTW